MSGLRRLPRDRRGCPPSLVYVVNPHLVIVPIYLIPPPRLNFSQNLEFIYLQAFDTFLERVDLGIEKHEEVCLGEPLGFVQLLSQLQVACRCLE